MCTMAPMRTQRTSVLILILLGVALSPFAHAAKKLNGFYRLEIAFILSDTLQPKHFRNADLTGVENDSDDWMRKFTQCRRRLLRQSFPDLTNEDPSHSAQFGVFKTP